MPRATRRPLTRPLTPCPVTEAKSSTRLSASPLASAPATMAAARARATAAAHDLVEGLGELVALGVLEREHVDAALASLGYVHPLDQLEQPVVVALGGHDEQGVVALVGDHPGPTGIGDGITVINS